MLFMNLLPKRIRYRFFILFFIEPIALRDMFHLLAQIRKNASCPRKADRMNLRSAFIKAEIIFPKFCLNKAPTAKIPKIMTKTAITNFFYSTLGFQALSESPTMELQLIVELGRFFYFLRIHDPSNYFRLSILRDRLLLQLYHLHFSRALRPLSRLF